MTRSINRGMRLCPKSDMSRYGLAGDDVAVAAGLLIADIPKTWRFTADALFPTPPSSHAKSSDCTLPCVARYLPGCGRSRRLTQSCGRSARRRGLGKLPPHGGRQPCFLLREPSDRKLQSPPQGNQTAPHRFTRVLTMTWSGKPSTLV
jgi:hypothetical protein